MRISLGAGMMQSFDAADYVSESDVEEDVSYAAGTRTGTFVVPSEADVEDGTIYGSAGEFEGTFEPADQEDVEYGVTYGGGGDELTGAFVVPLEEDVEDGVTYGYSAEFTGTFEAVIGGTTLMPSPLPTDQFQLDFSAPVERQIEMLYTIVQQVGLDAHLNAFEGLDRVKILSAVPTVDDLDEGQRVLAQDGTIWKLYFRTEGVLTYLSLAAV